MGKKLDVQVASYCAGILGVMVNGKRYEYDVSPFIAEKFEQRLKHNKGRAMAMLKGKELQLTHS